MDKVLSPLGGAGAQFFDADGLPLAGGLLYTYAAGTTTPQAAYTDATGATAHPNPIVLDASGRVPGGQVWVSPDLNYKFILADSVDATVATWDDLAGPDAANTPFAPSPGSTLEGKTTVQEALVALASSGPTLFPPGAVTMYAGATAPTGWLFCDGSVVSAADYTDLFAAIGNTHNVGGEAAGSFRLPDLRGRTPIGVGTGADLTARTLGAKGGEETHTLSNDEMPVHNHISTVNDPGHYHKDPTWNGISGTPYEVAQYGTTGFDYSKAADTSTNTTGITVDVGFSGGGSAHNNMQPFLALNFIIKT